MGYDIDDVIGMNQANTQMASAIEKSAPICHFRKMTFEYGDYDSYESDKWVCEVCGHHKEPNQ